MDNNKSKSLLFNNGEPVENITTAVIVNGVPNLTPRAYNLLDILAKKLMAHVLSTINISNVVLDTIITIRALRDTKITVEEYMSEIQLESPYMARNHLAQAGVELHSFFMSFYSNQEERISIRLKDAALEEKWNVGFLQNLMGDGKIYQDNGSLELEFNSAFVAFLAKKYRQEDYKNIKAEEYTAEQLLLDLMQLGFSYIQEYGFEVKGELPEHDDLLRDYIRTHYCLGKVS